MDKPTIGKMWKEFSDAVMPPNVHPVQVQETRRAFYAGVHSILMSVLEITGPDYNEDEGVEILNNFQKEIDRFAVDVQEGRA